jgi:hypothetical protein
MTNLGNDKFADLRTGTSHKFVDLRLRNEPKNLRICDLRTINFFESTFVICNLISRFSISKV